MSIKTVSLQTAQALKEAGFRQRNVSFFWATYRSSKNPPELYHNDLKDAWDTDQTFAAPTTDELLEKLPAYLNLHRLRILKYSSGDSTKYEVSYINLEHASFNSNILPEALASMWIWLKKEGLL